MLPEHAGDWPRIVGDFTAATRGEPGCLWFDWSALGELAVPDGR